MTADVAFFDALERLRAPLKRRVGKARADAPTERVVQREIVKALRKLGVFVIHVPNGSHLAGDAQARMRQSSALVADGMTPGFPDLMCINRGGEVGFIEVKREGGTVSADQERIAALIQSRGVPVAFVCTLDEALAAVRRWWAL
jgi:CheY-like chemotaxis protein